MSSLSKLTAGIAAIDLRLPWAQQGPSTTETGWAAEPFSVHN